MFHREGAHLSKALNNSDELEGLPLNGNPAIFTSARVPLLNSLIESLKWRYADTQEGVMHAAQVASFKQWPQNDEDQSKLKTNSS